MHNHLHPDPEQLDRLRAGLLDDKADEKALLEQHMDKCSTCRTQFQGWARLGATMMDAQLPADALHRDLQRARRVALSSRRHRGVRSFVPYATAALLLVAVTVGLWTMQPGDESQPLLTARSTETIPDTYEDLDFYLWLANQKDAGSDEDQSEPNNT
jgi:predicted anti-sigma-YlaC factor YlaD